ncbi:MAG: hypothetical protein ABI824_08100 [Acidobacteriota bacterium]
MPTRSDKSERKSPAFWIAVGVGALFATVLILFGVIYTLGKRNFAVGDNIAGVERKIQSEPNKEILGVDPSSGWVTFRDKITGKRSRSRSDPEKKMFVTEDAPDVTPVNPDKAGKQ